MPGDDLLAIKGRAAERLTRIPGVTGVGIGGRERAGVATGEPVIKVYVAYKRPRGEVAPGELIPDQIEGVGIDIAEMGPAELHTGPETPHPPGRPLVAENDVDDERRRPLIGGCMTQSQLTGAGSGTLGAFVKHQLDPAKIYALTNFHVVGQAEKTKLLAIKDVTRVGQAEGSDSPTKCCSALYGTYAGGGRDNVRDAALVQLDPGTRWLAEVLEIGPITGVHILTLADIQNLDYQVRKRGVRTRLTGGIVEALNYTPTDGIEGFDYTNITVVRPNPDPGLKAGTELYFSMPGDSGSVIVNEANEVVALHIAGDKLPNRGKGLELPIEVVLSLFQSQDSIPVEFATTTATGIVNIVPGGAQVAIPAELTRGLTGEQAAHPVLVPATAPWLPGVELPTAQSLGGLQEDLDRSAAGRALITLWLAHHRELIDLIEGNRRVALAWHRNGGPALLQMFVRMTGRAQLRLPPTLDGRPLDGCLDRIHDAFARFASPRLRADLDQARATLPDLGGLTYPQMINALGD